MCPNSVAYAKMLAFVLSSLKRNDQRRLFLFLRPSFLYYGNCKLFFLVLSDREIDALRNGDESQRKLNARCMM